MATTLILLPQFSILYAEEYTRFSFLYFHLFRPCSVFSVVPLQCGYRCRCHYDYQLNYNIYNCSGTDIVTLPDPSNLTEITDVLDISKGRIPVFCGRQVYLRTVLFLDLSNNLINKVCEDTVIYIKTGSMLELNLANNRIITLPSKLSNISSLQSVKLSGNNYICDCKMTWMIQWLLKRNLNNNSLIEDRKNVVCRSGMLLDQEIFQMTPEKMGCYPHKLSVGEKVTIGIFGALIVGIVVAIIAISRRWNEVKWLLYLHFNILDKSDNSEDLNDKKYDAFLSYRYCYYVSHLQR